MIELEVLASVEELYGIPRKQFLTWINDWYAAQKPSARDKALTFKFPAEFKVLPKPLLYRYVDVPEKLIKQLYVDGKSILLPSKYQTSSWSPSNLGANGGSSRRSGMLQIVIKKAIPSSAVILNSVKLTKANPWLSRELDSTARDSIYSEKEVIVRNTKAVMTIKPSEVISIEGHDTSKKDGRYWLDVDYGLKPK